MFFIAEVAAPKMHEEVTSAWEKANAEYTYKLKANAGKSSAWEKASAGKKLMLMMSQLGNL